MLEILPWTTAAVTAAMFTLWLLSLVRRDASIVDIFWGLGFVLIAWTADATHGIPADAVVRAAADSPPPGRTDRAALVLAMTTLWGLRLAAYLAWRNLGSGEDYRYAAMRRRHGPRFALVSLGTVFALQGVLMLVVSLPVQAAIVAPPSPLGLADAAGVALWATGLFFETVGDLQLARFRADPANRGRVLDHGLWAWTRHPNYFGDFCVWWGLGAVALGVGAWWSLIGPAVMSVLLMRVSGAALLERGLRRSKPAYAEYEARTPAFFPRPPSRR